MNGLKHSSPIRRWLRTIADCGVLRVGFDCDVLFTAWELGLVDCVPVNGREDALDFRLTDEGKRNLELWKVAA